jgi:hypothetical protein
MAPSNFSTAPVYDSEICYDRLTKDYMVIVAGEVVGYAPSYHAAEQVRTAALAERSGGIWTGK